MKLSKSTAPTNISAEVRNFICPGDLDHGIWALIL